MLLPRLRPLTSGHCQVCTGRGWRWLYLLVFADGYSAWVCAQCRLAWWRLEQVEVEAE